MTNRNTSYRIARNNIAIAFRALVALTHVAALFTGMAREAAAAAPNAVPAARLGVPPLLARSEATAAAGTFQLAGPSGPLSSTSLVAVEVRVSGAQNLAAWELSFSYDPAMLTVAGMSNGGLFTGGSTCAPASARCAFLLGPVYANGTASVGMATYGSGAAVSGNGLLGYLYLQPKARAGATTLRISNARVADASGAAVNSSGNEITLNFLPPSYKVHLPLVAQQAARAVAAAEVSVGDTAEDAQPVNPAPEPEIAAPDGVADFVAARALEPDAVGLLESEAAYCGIGDLNCDAIIDIRDVQPIANSFGRTTNTPGFVPSYDIDLSGVIDLDDLTLNGAAYQSRPSSSTGGPPRLGYAVNITGQVFLRWSLPITPYVAPVDILRTQLISGVQPLTPTIIASVSPITSDAQALPLLGAYWGTMAQMSFTTDISGVTTPATFTTVTDMHIAVAAGKGNLLGINQLVNTSSGVARVMGKGYTDAPPAPGVYAYWVRMLGRTVGPIRVDITNRTVVPAPRNLIGVNGTALITAPPGTRERANQQRFAHATIFLDWRQPAGNQYGPVWMFGYDVLRKTCDAANPAQCTSYQRINEEPVQQRANTALSSAVITNTGNPSVTLNFNGSTDVTSIPFDYADRNLTPGALYCYRVSARDLLGQPGLPSNEVCRVAPDFKGPRPPLSLFAGIVDGDEPTCDPRVLLSWKPALDAVRYDIYRSTPPSGTARGEWQLIGDAEVGQTIVSNTNSFIATGVYTWYRDYDLNLPPSEPPVRTVTWQVDASATPRVQLTGARVTPVTLNLNGLFNNSNARVRGTENHNARTALHFADFGVTPHNLYRYRVVGYDARGNMGAPSELVELRVKNLDGRCLPAQPAFGQAVTDASYVRLYRKFGSDGQPMLMKRIPAAEWNAGTKQPTDYFSPTVEMDVSYEVRTENQYGELSAASARATRTLIPTSLRLIAPAQPIIVDARLLRANQNGTRATAKLEWSMPGAGSTGGVFIYRSKGVTMPTDVASMTLIYSGSASLLRTDDITRTYKYTDNDNKLKTTQTYWYMVRNSNARLVCAPNAVNCATGWAEVGPLSNPRPAMYVARVGEPVRDVEPLTATLRAMGTLGGDAIYDVSWEAGPSDCCFVVFRSRDGVNWTPLTDAVVGNSYRDNDDASLDGDLQLFYPDTRWYQVVKLDAGYRNIFGTVNMTGATGELVAASDPLSYTWNSGLPMPGTTDYTAGPASAMLPFGVPKLLKFGAFTVEVTSGSVSGLFNNVVSGSGAITLTLPRGLVLAGADVDGKSGLSTRIKVEFSGVTFTIGSGNVIGVQPAGYANVKLGNTTDCYLAERTGRTRFQLCDVRLDETGMIANQIILEGLGRDLVLWDVADTGGGNLVGSADTRTFNDVPIKNADLDWEKNFAGNNTCAEPVADVSHLFSHADWPFVIVPTGSFTYTERSVAFTTVCTHYRPSRFSGVNGSGGALNSLNYTNLGFLEPDYTSSTAGWTVSSGLTGTFNYNGAHAYTLAFPFRLVIDADDWRFRFENGRLVSGHAKDNGVLTMLHHTSADHQGLNTFSASFTRLDLGLNGAMTGTITATTPISWATFTHTGTSYSLYVPPAFTPDEPALSWPAERGNAASGLDATGLRDNEADENPGINAFKRGLIWDACPLPAIAGASNVITFDKTPSSSFKMYWRYSGANGQVNMTTSGAPKQAAIDEFAVNIERFSQSWLDNRPYSASGLGDLFLPYPVSMTLEYIGMGVDDAGCLAGGAVLPVPGKLHYWDVDITPNAAEFRENPNTGKMNVWLLGSYTVSNLKRVDGGVDDPTVEIEISFNAKGNFVNANAYPQPSVYEVDGFYTVIEAFSLSACNPTIVNDVITVCNGPAGGAPWDPNLTIRPALTLGNKGFVKLDAAVNVPWFGEPLAASTNIYLQGKGDYIGFKDQPRLSGQMSELLDTTFTLDLVYAQSTELNNSRWVGYAKQGAQRDIGFVETQYSAVITPDNTSLTFGFPALSAAMLGIYEVEREYDNSLDREGVSGDYSSEFSSYRSKLGVSGAAYNSEYEAALDVALTAANHDSRNLTYQNINDILNDALPDDYDEITAWMSANGIDSSVNARSGLLQKFLNNSPVKIQWLRGGTQLIGVRDDTGVLYDSKIGIVEMAGFITVLPGQSSNSATNVQPLFDAAAGIKIDTVHGVVNVEANGISTKMLGKNTSIDMGLELYYGGASGYGIHGNVVLRNLALELATIERGSAVFGYTIKNNQLDELYLGATLDGEIETGAFGRLDIGGSFLAGRLDPGHATLQADYGDLFDEMDAQAGEVIQGFYMSVYANNIPIVSIADCVVVKLTGGGGLAFWIFTNEDATDTAWGTRISGFVQGKAAVCLAAAAANVDLTLDNPFGESGTELKGEIFVGAGCGFCEPDEWITPEGYDNDKGCLKCGLTVNFIVPLDGSPAPYMQPEPQFNCG